MPVVKMRELARAVSSYFGGIEIQTIGKRPGEKMYEELMTSEIARNTCLIMEIRRNLQK